jgi:hypothetical protein
MVCQCLEREGPQEAGFVVCLYGQGIAFEGLATFGTDPGQRVRKKCLAIVAAFLYREGQVDLATIELFKQALACVANQRHPHARSSLVELPKTTLCWYQSARRRQP